MKTKNIAFGIILLLAGGISLGSCDTTTDPTEGLTNSLVTVEDDGTTLINSDELKTGDPGTGTITDAQIEWLKFMREEEKVARDLYLALSADFTVPVFKNIARAEQTHMTAILTMLSTYEIEDPASSEPGVFNNPDLQELYNTLLTAGKVSLVEALKVGALVEETDILDLAGVYELNPGTDIIALAEALMLGSRNHLRAFTRVLKVNGIAYIPVALDADEYNAIITTGWERGTGLCISTSTSDGCRYLTGTGRGFWWR